MEKNRIKEYLVFNKKERIGFLIVIAIVAIIFSYPFLIGTKGEPLVIPDELLVKQEKKENRTNGEHEQNDFKQVVYDEQDRRVEAKLFYFDPNTVSPEAWRSLGLREKTIRTISNYLSKDGSFKKPEDLKKIYGLHEDEYERLKPYIRISPSTVSKTEQATPHYTKEGYHKGTPSFAKKVIASVDINTADTTALIDLPGIGSKLAARIVNFRSRLGGFYSIDQLAETYGLPDSTFQLIRQYLKLNVINVRQININTATVDELKSHPYIKWNIANAIVNYRKQHGNFIKPEELKGIVIITDEMFQKIRPYIECTP